MASNTGSCGSFFGELSLKPNEWWDFEPSLRPIGCYMKMGYRDRDNVYSYILPESYLYLYRTDEELFWILNKLVMLRFPDCTCYIAYSPNTDRSKIVEISKGYWLRKIHGVFIRQFFDQASRKCI